MADPRAKFVLSAEDRTTRAFGSVNRGLSAMGNAARSVSRSIGRIGTAAVLGGLTAAMASLRATASEVDAIAKTSRRIDASPEFMSEMRLGVDKAGLSFDTFSDSLQRMRRRISETATTGKGEAAKFFDFMGVNASRLAGMDMGGQLEVVAEGLSMVENAGQRLMLARSLFGRSGEGMTELVAGGAAGIRAMRAEARDMGLSFSASKAANVERFNDAMAELQGTLKGFAEGEGLKAFTTLAASATEATKGLKHFVGFFYSPEFERVSRYIGDMADNFDRIGKSIGRHGAVLGLTARGEFGAAARLNRNEEGRGVLGGLFDAINTINPLGGVADRITAGALGEGETAGRGVDALLERLADYQKKQLETLERIENKPGGLVFGVAK